MNEEAGGSDPRVGVFVCACGGNISRVVDVKAVADYARDLENVVAVFNNRYSCSDPGQKGIQEKIREHGINRVVVAACSPKLHEPTFRNACEEAGLNPYLFEMANIREQGSWVHQEEPEAATAKAKESVRIAVAKASRLEPQEEIEVPVTANALVIGGGIAGIQAALDLADTGYKVYMVEKEASIGGIMAQLDKTFPTMDCSI
jgi:heterodisulfide reductase subunit A